MWKYVLRRLGLLLPTLLGVVTVVFLLMRVIPGDIVELRIVGEGGTYTEDMLRQERARLGLDVPVWRQYVDYVAGLTHFDFGRSMWTGDRVAHEIGIRFQLSLEVAILATVAAVFLAIPLGMLAALKQDTWVDYAVRVFSIAGLAMPSFWLGALIILGFLIFVKWLPPMVYTPIWQDPVANLSQLVWPALAVGYRYSAVATRMTRSAMLEVLREDYVRTARAKGLWQRLIVTRHALKNAMLPVLTVIGLEAAFLMGGLVVTEQVFNLNGLGLLLVDAVVHRDYTLVQALVVLTAVVYVLVNFVVDILYAWLDPRVRYQ